MNKIKIYLITFIFSIICYGNAVAGTGAATEYKITIYKIWNLIETIFLIINQQLLKKL